MMSESEQAALRAWVELNPRRAKEMALELRKVRAKVAREDPDTFMEYVLKSENDGSRVVQAPLHRQFQALVGKYPRLILWSHVEGGKTNQVSIGRVLWELGRNPNLRVAVCSNRMRQSEKILSTIRQYIENSRELHDVFPELRPGDRWAGDAITIKRNSKAKDPSVQVFSSDTGTVLGSRIDQLYMDDVITDQSTRSAARREQTWNWYQGTLEGRLTRDARVTFVGNAFHLDDLLHRLSRRPEWHFARFPVMNRNTGELNWPEQWPLSRIESKRASMTPHEFSRQLMCEVLDDSSSRFKRAWINTALARGEGRSPAFALTAVPDGYRVFTGVDLAVSKKSSADLTVLFTIIVHPDESREVLAVESGRWGANEIIERIVDVHDRFGSIMCVESNAAQRYIAQFLSKTRVPVREFYTGANKLNADFGIESLATEMSNGKWIIPNRGGAMVPEIARWVDEMLYYDPTGHTGDRLMASWFAREAARDRKPKAQGVKVDLRRR